MTNHRTIWRGWALCLLAFLLLWMSGYHQAQASVPLTDPFTMEFPPIVVREITPFRYQMDNGVIIYLLPDRSLPLIQGTVLTRAGTVLDPDAQVGLASLTSSLLRSGGAGSTSASDVDERLEYLAASVESEALDSLARIRFSMLSRHAPEVLSLLADMLLDPMFDPDRLELHRGRVLEAIRRQNDQPVEIALREFFYRVAYGHPAGQYPSVETVMNIGADDIRDFHERYYQPTSTILALSGDFDTEEMLAQLQHVFGGWTAREVNYPELPVYPSTSQRVVYHADKEISQSIILVGHPSVTMHDPEYAGLDVLNRILGGAGENRLFREIRTKRGLAYAVGSQLTQGFAFPGTFFAFSISRGDRTVEVLNLLLQEMEGVRQRPVYEAELVRNREAILNRAVFRYSSAANIVERSAIVEFLGLDPAYYEHYIAEVQELTVDSLQALAREFLAPDQAMIMVVGDGQLFDGPLDQFGPVAPIELE